MATAPEINGSSEPFRCLEEAHQCGQIGSSRNHLSSQPLIDSATLYGCPVAKTFRRTLKESEDHLRPITDYYTEKITTFGPTPNGVDWKDSKSQSIRLEKIAQILPRDEIFSLNDLGCGYGELAIYLRDSAFNFRYFGYDVSEKMIEEARKKLGTLPNVTLYTSSKLELEREYSVASGIFSVKAEVEKQIWEKHILDTINMMYEKTTKAFSFNILSSHSDKSMQKEHLYYGDPSFFLRYCIENFSREVRLDHSYGLYEFTISVLKG
jgi:SAM-dependent methyltransferase